MIDPIASNETVHTLNSDTGDDAEKHATDCQVKDFSNINAIIKSRTGHVVKSVAAGAIVHLGQCPICRSQIKVKNHIYETNSDKIHK